MNLDHLPAYDHVYTIIEKHGGLTFLFIENMFPMPTEWNDAVTDYDARPDLTEYWNNAPLDFWWQATKIKPTLMHWPQHLVWKLHEDPCHALSLNFLENDYDCFVLWVEIASWDEIRNSLIGKSKILSNYFLTVV